MTKRFEITLVRRIGFRRPKAKKLRQRFAHSASSLNKKSAPLWTIDRCSDRCSLRFSL